MLYIQTRAGTENISTFQYFSPPVAAMNPSRLRLPSSEEKRRPQTFLRRLFSRVSAIQNVDFSVRYNLKIYIHQARGLPRGQRCLKEHVRIPKTQTCHKICNELQPRMAFLYYNTAAAYVSKPISLNANVKSDKLHL